jgi:lysophospholipid acyltransferase
MVFDYIDTKFASLSDTIGLPDDQTKLVSCLLFSYPVGCIFKRISSPFLRHTIGIILGIFYQYLIFRDQIIHPIILTITNYALLKFLGRKAAMPTFAFTLVYLLAIHLRTMIVDYGGWRMDISATLMMYTCKWTAFAWCYKDGGKDDKDLSPDQKENKITELPSFFEYVSYIFFYASAIVGPFYDYKEHVDFIRLTGNYQNIPSCAKAGIAYMLSAFLAMAIVLFFGARVHHEFMITDEFSVWPMWKKVLFYNFSMSVYRCKYYTGWLLSTSNVTAAGLNYDSQATGKGLLGKFSKVVSVRPLDYELSDNIKDKLEAWNSSVQTWLKNYVYFRVTSLEEAKRDPKKATFASNVTFMTSALWHGLYPGYYITFFQMFLQQQANKFLFKARDKFWFVPIPVRTVLGMIVWSMTLNYSSVQFQMLDFGKAIAFGHNMYHFITIILLVLFIFFSVTGWGQKSRKTKEN